MWKMIIAAGIPPFMIFGSFFGYQKYLAMPPEPVSIVEQYKSINEFRERQRSLERDFLTKEQKLSDQEMAQFETIMAKHAAALRERMLNPAKIKLSKIEKDRDQELTKLLGVEKLKAYREFKDREQKEFASRYLVAGTGVH